MESVMSHFFGNSEAAKIAYSLLKLINTLVHEFSVYLKCFTIEN